MEEFNIQKIRHLLPADGINADLLSALYQQTCLAKQDMQDKVPVNKKLAEVKQFIQLIDQLRPYLQNGFSSAKVEKWMVRDAELIAAFCPPLDKNGEAMDCDVQKNRQLVMTALDYLHSLAGYAEIDLGYAKTGKGRPKTTERDVILYMLYDHLRKCGCKDGVAKIKAGQIMMVWGCQGLAMVPMIARP